MHILYIYINFCINIMNFLYILYKSLTRIFYDLHRVDNTFGKGGKMLTNIEKY